MRDEKKLTIAAVFAHPDDETLGCGGTLATLSDKGHEIIVVICGEGITSRYNDPCEADPEDNKTLQLNLKKAAEILGVSRIIHMDWPDNRFDTRPLLLLVKAIERQFAEISPQIIYTHHPSDLNVDHRMVYDAVLTAARPVPKNTVTDIYACEVPSSTGWEGPKGNAFSPTMYRDITPSLDRKIKAMEAYQTEALPYPHPRSPEGIRALAQYRGAQSGLFAAEAFVVVRQIRKG